VGAADCGIRHLFKGGTSLSKGFGLIERFSEDLDLKVEPGSVRELPAVSNWKSEGTKAIAARMAYFEELSRLLRIPGAEVVLDRAHIDRAWRGANIRVIYPGRHLHDLGVMAPFVRDRLLGADASQRESWDPPDGFTVHAGIDKSGSETTEPGD
jgi:hypothetical protein